VEAVTDYRESWKLWCSPGELQQILTNILNNAPKRAANQGL